MTGSEKQLDVSLVSPDGVIWSGKASFVILPAVDGELGIFPEHAALLAMLGSGEMRIRSGPDWTYFALFGGFLQVRDDQVQVIVDRAERPDQIDVAAANAELARLAEPSRRNVDLHEAELESRLRARTRIRVASRRGR